ncbi:UNKNOWN [Stylonychia lemnae]|uniref:Glycosyltransferase 2-like domain-containing protein n=1 Tax=Stylonychia lemnae TaxID=5949 RepID=A0A078BD72_STYLE|nr:UNKNOWN [Stylonychia lemnae]|eukprot:CDW91533.1 UNKNOWN [Stylonychia lemnae]
MSNQFYVIFLFLLLSLTQVTPQEVSFYEGFVTILIYGDGSLDDLQRNLDFTKNQPYYAYEVLVAVKNKEIIHQISINIKHQENIQMIETKDVDDFAKILKSSFHLVNGEYIALINTRTTNKRDRILQQVYEARTQNYNVVVSEIEILNEQGEPQDNSYLIDVDYARNLDGILFSTDFRLEAAVVMRKLYFAEILNQIPEINRYYAMSQFAKNYNVNFRSNAFTQISLNRYHQIYLEDSIVKPQQDIVRYLTYNSYLNNRNFQISTVQFSKILNCSYDFLGCDEQTLCLVGYLMIDKYLTDESVFYHQRNQILDQIQQIFNQSQKLDETKQNPIQHPLVSVIMTCYNRDYYLLKSIQHVFQQTYANWELLISDDGSHNPKTIQILQLVQNHPRIRVLHLYTNQYAAYALNFAISQAKGEYLAIQDDDDIMYPSRLHDQIDFLQRNLEYDICGAGFKRINEIGKPKFQLQKKETKSSIVIKLNLKMKELFIYNHSTACDYSLFLKLLFEVDQNIRFGYLPTFVVGIREHEKRISNNDNEVSHYKKWINLKQIEIAEKIYPEIFDNFGYKCFEKTFYSLTASKDFIETCKNHDIQQYFNQVKNGTIQKLFVQQKDIKDLDQFFSLYQYQYTIRRQLNQVKYLDQQRTFDCIVHQGEIRLLLLHIDQLKDYVDNFLVIYLKTPTDHLKMEDLKKHLVDQPRFEDKLQTIQVKDEYVNVHTMQTAGVYFDQFKCGFYQSKGNNKAKTQKQIANMSYAEKRKLEVFSKIIQEDLISYCGKKQQKQEKIIEDRPYDEL